MDCVGLKACGGTEYAFEVAPSSAATSRPDGPAYENATWCHSVSVMAGAVMEGSAAPDKTGVAGRCASAGYEQPTDEGSRGDAPGTPPTPDGGGNVVTDHDWFAPEWNSPPNDIKPTYCDGTTPNLSIQIDQNRNVAFACRAQRT